MVDSNNNMATDKKYIDDCSAVSYEVKSVLKMTVANNQQKESTKNLGGEQENASKSSN
jgi:hypothetical protein